MRSNTIKIEAIELLLDSNRGQYIPQHFTEEFNLELFGFNQHEIDNIKKDLSSPNNEYYWETWERVLNNAELQNGEHVYYLYQDGDLWLICHDLMTDEEKDNFGFLD